MTTTGARAAVSRIFPITARRPAFLLGRVDRSGHEAGARPRSWLAGVVLAILVGSPALAFEPRINYMLQCLGCHGPEGRGEPGHVPSMRSTLAPLAQVTAGRRYLVQVPGVAQSMLSDAEVAALLNWMIETIGRAGPDRFRPFSASEVAGYRSEPLVEVSATRARLLRKLKQRS